MRDIREKKHRLPREYYRGLVTVSLTACVDGRRRPFLEEAIVQTFLETLKDAVEKNGCSVYIYCFMPDHLHAILHGMDDDADSWRAMVDFKQKTGFWFCKQRSEFSWQKDFHDHVIRANEDLGAHVRYVADNPVRSGLVKLWSEYPHTGAIGFDLKLILADAASL